MSRLTTPIDESGRLSLVLGGPLYQLYLKWRLVRPPLRWTHRRIAALIMVTWVPLVVLTAIEGRLIGGTAVPFIFDISCHTRFLFSLPLLILAEPFAHMLLPGTVQQFIGRGLITPDDQPAFWATLESSLKLRNSVVIEVVILLVALSAGYWIWSRYVALKVSTWYAGGREEMLLTPAGYWYAFVSLPLFRFFALRWFFRLFLWYRFMLMVSRIPLRLDPAHPDRAGGLGFIGYTAFTILPVLMAQSALVSGKIADEIVHQGAKLSQFVPEIATTMVLLLVMAYLPVLFFGTHLAQAWNVGMHEYGTLASRYMRAFHDRWITPTGGESPPDAELLGHSDLRALAGVAKGFEIVNEMQVVPITRNSVLALTALLAAPIAPLIFTMIPAGELMNRLLKLFL